MHPDLESLLTLQADDEVIDALEERLRALDASVSHLEQERLAAREALEQAQAAVAAEEKRQREVQGRLDQHKTLQEKNLAQLDKVSKAREATAAMTQIDITRKALAQDESELHTLDGSLRTVREAAGRRETELREVEERQEAAREALREQRAVIDQELAAAREKRLQSAQRVSARLLAAYDRLRRRGRGSALAPVRGSSCGRCNTAIPLQRRNLIASGKSIESCEGCGVLLYAAV